MSGSSNGNSEITEGAGAALFSGPLSGPQPGKGSGLLSKSGSLTKRGWKSTRFNLTPSDISSLYDSDIDQEHVEVTLDISGDSVALHSIRPIDGSVEEEGPVMGQRTSSFRSSVLSSVSSSFRKLVTYPTLVEVSEQPRRLTTLSRKKGNYYGNIDRSRSAAAQALKVLKFITKNGGEAGWPEVERQFDDLTQSTNGLLHRDLFWKCIGYKESKEFAKVLFDALAKRIDIVGSSINKKQLREFWDRICDQNFDCRLQTFFDMIHKDAHGWIGEEDVKEIISLSASANKLSDLQKHSHEYAAVIMEALDPDNLKFIKIENLEMLLLEAPSQDTRGANTIALSQLLSQQLKPTVEPNLIRRWYRVFNYFLLDYWQRIWILTLWICVMTGLFTWKFIQYRNRDAYDVMGYCVGMAKGAAETLKLNMALILLPVCRNTITWLRNKTGLGIVVPFDDNIKFHELIAIAIMIGTAIHTIYHLTCDFPRLIHASPDKYYPMIQYFGEQSTDYWHFLKSFEGISGIVMVVVMTIAFTLATPWFRRRERTKLPKLMKKLTGFYAFWYSHHLFVIVYGLLIAHGLQLYLTREWYNKTTWMYLVVPITVYACERLTRALRPRIQHVNILKVAVYHPDALVLHMSKPKGFKYKSGQYMFVKCSVVSPFEWHPFSITSAPTEDYLSVHIRTLGDWTGKLKEEFSKVHKQLANGKSGLIQAEYMHGENNPTSFPKVSVDGPYGAPAQDYKKYDVVLLIGLGIGATPMISIVKDIVNNTKAIQEHENALENGHILRWKSNFKTRKAYFYWVTKEQGSFQWFKGTMDEIDELDTHNVIEMYNYCTSVYEEGDARSALITMLQSLYHAKKGIDVIAGTRVKSHFGRPKWRKVYKQIALNHPNGKIGVFYCGLPALVKELKSLSLEFSRKTSTKFEFHKENF